MFYLYYYIHHFPLSLISPGEGIENANDRLETEFVGPGLDQLRAMACRVLLIAYQYSKQGLLTRGGGLVVSLVDPFHMEGFVSGGTKQDDEGKPKKTKRKAKDKKDKKEVEEEPVWASTDNTFTFDPRNPFFSVEYGEDEEEKESYKEQYSGVEEAKKKRTENRRRDDFMCLTVDEVSRWYGVPLYWLGDALCTFGVPAPIKYTAVMGDMIDGEQAFTLLQAMHGWDRATFYEMYNNDSIKDMSMRHKLDLSEVLRVCDKQGFNLPFGIKSHLRLEHYVRLLRLLDKGDEVSDRLREMYPDSGDDSPQYSRS